MESQSFFAGNLTHICIFDLNHKSISALDQPKADDISHIIIFDSQSRPLSLLNINCDSCLIAQEDQTVRRLFAESLDAGDLPFRGPPPKYEVDKQLPDYHEQDQERGPNDRPRLRTNEQQATGEQQNPNRRSVFREIFDDAPNQEIAEEPLIDLAESESSDDTLIVTARSNTTNEVLIDMTEINPVASTVTARDLAYRSMDETTALAMLDRTFPALIPESSQRSSDPPHFGGSPYSLL